MKRNKYFITLIDKLHNSKSFDIVKAFTAKEAKFKALEKHRAEGYDFIESVTRIA